MSSRLKSGEGGAQAQVWWRRDGLQYDGDRLIFGGDEVERLAFSAGTPLYLYHSDRIGDNIRRLGEDDGISAYFWGSDIRGVAYLARVKQARAGLTRPPSS